MTGTHRVLGKREWNQHKNEKTTARLTSVQARMNTNPSPLTSHPKLLTS